MFELKDYQPARRVALLLLPGFSLHELALARAALTAANRLAEAELFPLTLYSLDGQPVSDADGLAIAVQQALPASPAYDLLFAFGGEPPASRAGLELQLALLPQAAKLDIPLLGVGGGVFWLALAGVMAGYKASVHWMVAERYAERFPQSPASSNLFEIDRNRMSCGGGMATLDLCLALIGRIQGMELAAAVSEVLMHERMRAADERQRVPLVNQLGGSAQPKLVKAVTLMEGNLEDPLTTDEIADRVCVSRRQLERLFKQHLNSVPSQYYLELRLKRARQLLLQTSKSIIQIGLSCGFSSGPHFSSAYRNHFGATPREDRLRNQPGRRAGPDAAES